MDPGHGVSALTRLVTAVAALAVSLLGLVVPAPVAHARNLLSADGPGGTYELIRTAYTTELPDCGHMVPHITEEMDNELGKNVFVFHAHVNQDDDRCGAQDRQRTEIRARAPDIVANNGETVYYRWKFKLPAGFQASPSFTHIFQIKSDLGAPVMTLTPRTSTFAVDGRIGARGATDLSKFIGVWVVVDLKVLVGAEEWERAFAREFDFVYRVLQRFGASASDAEDLAQEVFCVMWRRRGAWDPSRPLRAWLAGVAFRVARAHQRRQREIPDGVVDLPVTEPDADEQLGAAAARELVLRVLGALAPKDRALIVMHEIEGMPMKEVAEALSVPLFTAYSRVRVARNHFAREVRRLQLVTEARGGASRPVLLPAALLAFERQRPGPPAAIRERLLARLQTAQRIGGPPGRLLGRLTALAGGVAAVGMLALSTGRAVTAFPPATHSRTEGALDIATPPSSAKGVSSPVLVSAFRPAAERDRREALMAARLSRGMVAYWRFDDGFGSEAARDLSGNGLDCVLRRLDPVGDWSDGVHAGAIRLRNSGWLECPRTTALDRVSTELTIAAWVSRPDRQPNLRTIVSRQRGAGAGDDYYLGFVDGDLIFASDIWQRLRRPLPRMSSRWLHVAVTRHQDGTAILYADGRELGRLTGPPVSLATSGRNPLLLGAAINGPDPARVNQKLMGAFDEVIIYDRALDDQEVTALADGTQPRL